MKNISLRHTILCAALALAAGCATVNTVEPAVATAKPDKVADKRIITNDTLNAIAYVVEVDRAKTPEGYPIVQVQLQNKKSGVKNVNYRFTWFDADGIALNNDPVVKTISLEGGETRLISDVATSPKAVDWKLSLYESVGRTPGTF
ncbi:MAG TPA: DUF1425 domain-containing protein [Opitutales bacterium]|nr:DUF1425 domain-containing protein [Opitutales bacterium]